MSRLMHTMVRVMNLDRSLQFYTGMLGMKEIRRSENESQRYTLVFVGYGEVSGINEIELTYNWDQKEPYAIGTAFGHLAVGVPDVAATCERLRTAGVTISREAGPVKGGTAVIAFVEDPDGYKIELVQRA